VINAGLWNRGRFVAGHTQNSRGDIGAEGAGAQRRARHTAVVGSRARYFANGNRGIATMCRSRRCKRRFTNRTNRRDASGGGAAKPYR
jgi:hypothetical protein